MIIFLVIIFNDRVHQALLYCNKVLQSIFSDFQIMVSFDGKFNAEQDGNIDFSNKNTEVESKWKKVKVSMN